MVATLGARASTTMGGNRDTSQDQFRQKPLYNGRNTTMNAVDRSVCRQYNHRVALQVLVATEAKPGTKSQHEVLAESLGVE